MWQVKEWSQREWRERSPAVEQAISDGTAARRWHDEERCETHQLGAVVDFDRPQERVLRRKMSPPRQQHPGAIRGSVFDAASVSHST